MWAVVVRGTYGGWGRGDVRWIGVMCNKVRCGHHRPTHHAHLTHTHTHPAWASRAAHPAGVCAVGCGLWGVGWGGQEIELEPGRSTTWAGIYAQYRHCSRGPIELEPGRTTTWAHTLDIATGQARGKRGDRLGTRQGQATRRGHARDRLGTRRGQARDRLGTTGGQPRDTLGTR